MTRSMWFPVTLTLACGFVFNSRCSLSAQQPAQAPAARFKQLAPGILGSTEAIFATDSLPRYRIEVRDLVMGPNQAAQRVPLEGFAIMELRAGAVEATVDGKRSRREAGSYWCVSRGAKLAIRNVSEVAAIRATVFVPR